MQKGNVEGNGPVVEFHCGGEGLGELFGGGGGVFNDVFVAFYCIDYILKFNRKFDFGVVVVNVAKL